jgi:hypothetical protein
MICAALESSDLGIILGAAGVIWAPMLAGLIAINTRTKAINSAVNNRPVGEPTIYERVAQVEATVKEAASTAADVKARLESQDRVDTMRHNENKTSIAAIEKAVRTLGVRLGKLEAGPAAPRRTR